MVHLEQQIIDAVSVLQQGGIIACPTEAVFGLGCVFDHQQGLEKLLELKQRSSSKGFIIVGATLEQLQPLMAPGLEKEQQQAQQDWPGPVTWVFPASEKVPALVRGDHSTVAVRVSAHPVLQKVCQELGQPIISTSANKSGQEALREADQVRKVFPQDIYIIDAACGGRTKPTPVRDVMTGEYLRK